MKVNDVNPPDIHILAKDHKDIPQSQSHPKTRAVSSAKTGPISRVQNFMNSILGYVAKTLNAPTECMNTEVMKRGISDTNNNIELSDDNLNTVIMSLDVCALYPSITKETAMKSIIKMTIESGISFKVNIK